MAKEAVKLSDQVILTQITPDSKNPKIS
jgi:hypothetical protein